METQPLSTAVILATLEELSKGVSCPLWLFGGVAVDFLAGRWTRPHGDIDLNALSIDRDQIIRELNGLGYASSDADWLTHWRHSESGRGVELVFLEPAPHGQVELVIHDVDTIGVPGRYAMVPGYLDPKRSAVLDGIRFRVCSPAGEWIARMQGSGVIAGRSPEPKIEHDLRVLESIMTDAELTTARNFLKQTDGAGRRSTRQGR